MTPLFPPDWFAAGIVTAESAADFARLAAASSGKSARFWRWAAFRDWAEERTPLTAAECLAAYRLGVGEPDAALGAAIACSVLYQPRCPAEVFAEAASSDRAAVRRAAGLRPYGRSRPRSSHG
jgi:hypothetical protein